MTTQELAEKILAIIKELDIKMIVGRENFWYSDAMDSMETIENLCKEQLTQNTQEVQRSATMSENARDTQFQGFAEVLYAELAEEMMASWRYASTDAAKQKRYTLIARRVYDLVQEVVNIAPVSEYPFNIRDVPDMPMFPQDAQS